MFNGVTACTLFKLFPDPIGNNPNKRVNTKRVLNYYDWIEDYSTYHYFKYEAIKWRVLNVSNGGALLLADQALDSQRYNQNSEDITWEKSSIRSWLNAQDTINNQEGINYRKGNFLNEAFFLSVQEIGRAHV